MRIWSMHPKYLDTKGLVALWRESLLAKNVLEGKTKGYRMHPQLVRFRETEKPMEAINYYLIIVWEEAQSRQYNFDRSKFSEYEYAERIELSDGQLLYEKEHLLQKLKVRDNNKYKELLNVSQLEIHPIFKLTTGGIQDWEKR